MIHALVRELTINGIAPSYIEQISDTLTYIGFCKPGTKADDDSKWCIKKVEQIGTVTKTTFAEGSTSFNLQWSERAGYSYAFRK